MCNGFSFNVTGADMNFYMEKHTHGTRKYILSSSPITTPKLGLQ